ncbi:hypothetical protein M2322_002676 [Rhodoblastus acidophilus]|nr:hypothetical protein [Rhodoblastus acidophilus]
MAKEAQEAIEKYHSAVADYQCVCPHHRVLHADYNPQTWFPDLTARRICIDCGFEETSDSLFSWSGKNAGGHTTLPEGEALRLTTEFVKHVSGRAELYRYRPQWR